EHRAERSFLADGGTAQHFRTRALCTTLQSLGLALVQRLAGTLELSGKLGDGALQLAYLALERCVGQRRSLSTLGLCLFRSARGENLAIARAVAVHRDALAVQGVRQFVDLLHVFACGGVREVRGLRDGGVAVLLEGSLHANVVFRRDR